MPADRTTEDPSYEKYDRENQRRLATQRNQRHEERWWRWYLVLGVVLVVIDIGLLAVYGWGGPSILVAVTVGVVGGSFRTAYRGSRMARRQRDGEQ